MSNHGNVIVRPLAQVFQPAATPNVGSSNVFRLQRPVPNQACAVTNEFTTRLTAGFRFIFTPGHGFCGIHAMILGLEAWMQQQGRQFNINDAWARLERYFGSRKYLYDALTLMWKLAPQGVTLGELMHPNNHGNLQLQLFALELSPTFLGPLEVISLVFVRQATNGQSLHFAQDYDIVEAHQIPVRLFIHSANNHYQAFALQQHGLSIQDQLRVLGDEPGHHSDAPKTKPRGHHNFVPDGEKLLWLQARIDTDAAGRTHPCKTPMKSRDLELLLRLGKTAAVRHRVKTAKAAYLKKYGSRSVRGDKQSRAEIRRRNAAVARPQNAEAAAASANNTSATGSQDNFQAIISRFDGTHDTVLASSDVPINTQTASSAASALWYMDAGPVSQQELARRAREDQHYSYYVPPDEDSAPSWSNDEQIAATLSDYLHGADPQDMAATADASVQNGHEFGLAVEDDIFGDVFQYDPPFSPNCLETLIQNAVEVAPKEGSDNRISAHDVDGNGVLQDFSFDPAVDDMLYPDVQSEDECRPQ